MDMEVWEFAQPLLTLRHVREADGNRWLGWCDFVTMQHHRIVILIGVILYILKKRPKVVYKN